LQDAQKSLDEKSAVTHYNALLLFDIVNRENEDEDADRIMRITHGSCGFSRKYCLFVA
jgi:hypothetical protein